MTDIIEECARAAARQESISRRRDDIAEFEDLFWHNYVEPTKAVLRVLRDRLFINIEGLTAIKDAEEKRK